MKSLDEQLQEEEARINRLWELKEKAALSDKGGEDESVSPQMKKNIEKGLDAALDRYSLLKIRKLMNLL
jgi:hypothetical protein